MRQEAIARAREIREGLARDAESERDRTFRREETTRGFDQQRDLMGEQFAHADKLAAGERDLMTRRWGREDRRSVEEQTNEQMRALDRRGQELQDALHKGEFMSPEAEQSVAAEIRPVAEQKLRLRADLVTRLAEMDDPRYAKMSRTERLYAAGYSKDQVAAFMRLGGLADESVDGSSSVSEPPAETPVAASSNAPQERESAAIHGPPASPEPLADMSKEGRPKRVRRGQGRAMSETGFADEAEALRTLFVRQPWISHPGVRKNRGLPPLYETGGGF